MRIMVVDVAAEYGGAKTILDQFRKEFENDKANNYIVLISKLQYEDTNNVKYIMFPDVKKNYFNRAFFDRVTVAHLVKQYKPNLVISLQNNAVNSGKVEQYVYFQNAIPFAKRIKFNESKSLWVYQHFIARIIRNSLKKAKLVIVQAGWVKLAMAKHWNIEKDRIVVKKPFSIVLDKETRTRDDEDGICKLFYPAGYSLYKNHYRLLQACKMIWDKYGVTCGLQLTLTGEKDKLPSTLKNLVKYEDYPITFAGRLNSQEMNEQYLRSTLIFPSYIETVGLPIIEAKECGAKIVCSDLEYSRESVGDYNDVLFFDPYSIDSIADAVLKCMKECHCAEI